MTRTNDPRRTEIRKPTEVRGDALDMLHGGGGAVSDDSAEALAAEIEDYELLNGFGSWEHRPGA